MEDKEWNDDLKLNLSVQDIFQIIQYLNDLKSIYAAHAFEHEEDMSVIDLLIDKLKSITL